MCALQKLSVEAQDQTLNNWFQQVVSSMKEVEVNKDKKKLYISDSPFFMYITTIICWNKMCLTLPLLSFDDNKVLKIVNWIC